MLEVVFDIFTMTEFC